jgi:acyl-coenzyme A thioesterase PaaI-like protein
MDAFQDHYPENVSHCYGCGHLNEHGHQIKTVWEGDETVTRFTPEPYHTSVPGYAYGGLIASLIDCHCTGTAAAAMYKQEGRSHDSLPAFRFVTGSLHVDFLKPTPLESELVIRGRVKEIKGRKVVVEATVYAGDVATARGEVVAVQMPESFGQ